MSCRSDPATRSLPSSRDAVALACRVLDSLRKHAWEGDADGPVGPWDVPAARGLLFLPPANQEAA